MLRYVNTDVPSPDFLQPVDNSGSGDNSTKTTNDDSVCPRRNITARLFLRLSPEPNSISPFWSSSAVTGIPAPPPQRVVREEEQSANNPRITANSATFSRCTQSRVDDFVGWLVRSMELNLRRVALHPIGKFMPQGAAQFEAL
jgi:hypothetical protein